MRQRTDLPSEAAETTVFHSALPIVRTARGREKLMLETIAVILVALWVLGLVTSTTMGGLIHALLVIAIVVILVRLIQGRQL